METLTTFGNGNINYTTHNEKIFGMFMEVVVFLLILGLWHQLVIMLKNCQILEEIELIYPKLSDDLYDIMSRYLKYKMIKNN